MTAAIRTTGRFVVKKSGRRTAALQNLRRFKAHAGTATASWSAAVPFAAFLSMAD
jgi:hypothetical protein